MEFSSVGSICFKGIFILLLLGFLSSLIAASRPASETSKALLWISHISAILAGISGILSAVSMFAVNHAISFSAWNITPNVVLGFRLDSLSALFLLIISIVAVTAALYSIRYITIYETKKNTGLLCSGFNLFLLSMIMVVTVDNGFTFLLTWELMSLTSFFLVMFEHEKPKVRHAGYVYVVMTHFGTLFLFILFLILFFMSGSLSFTAFHNISQHLPLWIKNLIFLLALIGFGTKAGIIPLHVWLPRAHPAAPSHVSALMSAVMIKTAIYGFLRVVYDFLGNGPVWWGITVLLVGALSAIIGILYGVSENDIKRFLAYSSTENIGVIFMAIGASLLFNSYHHPLLALLAMTAALYHVINHAIFKGLLFMAAGSVVYATDTKNINKLGGLIRKMPWTAGMFLIGGMALSAFPPFNGFLSEWAIFQSLLHLAFDLKGLGWKIVGGLAAALLGMTGALVAAGVVKNFGTVFLAMPRTKHAEHAREVPLTMRLGMIILAGCSVLLGIWPGIVIRMTNVVMGNYFSESLAGNAIFYIPFPKHTAESVSLAGTLSILLVILLFTILILRLWLGKNKKTIAETWNCGTVISPAMEYTGTSYSHPVLMIFKWIYRPVREVDIRGEYKYYPKQIIQRLQIRATIETFLYKPIIKAAVFVSKQIRVIQNGNLQLYLSFMVATLIILLLYAK